MGTYTTFLFNDYVRTIIYAKRGILFICEQGRIFALALMGGHVFKH